MTYAEGPYTLQDKETGGLYGPYEFMSEARAQASRFNAWQIIDDLGQLVCEGRTPAFDDEAFIPH